MCRKGNRGAIAPKRPGLYVVGLTGGIATGKSTVSQMLTELGAEVIDADKLARQVVEPGSNGFLQVTAAFGPGIVSEKGELDRKELGKIVFSCEDARKALEAIIHPLVFELIEDTLALRAQEWQECGEIGVIVLDVPLLYETGADRFADEVWVVWACQKTQENRLMERDGFAQKEAQLRIQAQMPLKEKAWLADRVVRNQGSLDDTRRQVEVFWDSTQKELKPGKPKC